ncbi:hypothetical protein ACFFGT_10505 [Mucilaginibacter angelicae]|uniref:DUF2254 domain-containing protein n=1 Tax=Mucilaginibacter angelicae TaxID=869718 RepID=A0ABV6L5C7_9SPHI
MFIRPKRSLRHQTQFKIYQKYPELKPGRLSFLKSYLNFLSDKKSWWAVFLNVLVIFLLLVYGHIPHLDFIELTTKTAETIVDQRTSNVATIISMTLAVIGLLLSNLAIKDSQTYKLLFLKSRLYFIIYYILSAIFCLIVGSTLRDTLSPERFKDLVLAGTYLALSILLLIGFLFSAIINFANSGNIQKILKAELIRETKNNIGKNLVIEYSREIFLKIMKDHKIDEYSLDISFSKWHGTTMGADNSEDKPLVYELDPFKRLSKWITNLFPKFSKRNTNHGNTIIEIEKQGVEFERSYKKQISKLEKRAGKKSRLRLWNYLLNIGKQIKWGVRNLFIARHYFPSPEKELKEKLIVDLDTKRLTRYLKKDPSTMQKYYTERISLDMATKSYTNFIYPNVLSRNKGIVDIQKCLKLKNADTLMSSINEYQQYFDTKMEEYSVEGKHKNIAQILDIYLEVYQLQMKFQS